MNALVYAFWNQPERRLRAGWRLLIHLFLTAFFAIGFTLPAALLLYVFNAVSTESEDILMGPLQGLGILVSSLLAYFLIDRRKLRDLKLTRGFLTELGGGFLLGALLMTGIFVTEWSAGWIAMERVGASPEWSVMRIACWQLGWFGLMWLVGLSEELFSRGLQMKNFAEGLSGLGLRTSSILAVLLSSAFFGFLHWGNPNATTISTISIACAGVLLSIAWLRTGRLALPIGLHASWNYFQGPVFGFAVSGNPTPGSFVESTSIGPQWLTGGEFGPEAGVSGMAAMFIGIVVIVFWPSTKRDFVRNVVVLNRAPR